jgi:TatD DNase family protein
MQDIHTHLYWDSYDADRDTVIARARAAGVDQMFVIGCTIKESRQCVALTEQYPEIYASVGIHPHFFNELVEKSPITEIQDTNNHQSLIIKIQELTQELRELAKNKKVVAIGECGLDYYAHDRKKIISDEQKIIQREGFLAQVELAQELNLPLIVHCRPSNGTQDAYLDLYQMLSDQHSSCVLHCYMGDTEVTQKFLTLPNVYFSFTGNITYPVKKVLVGTKDDLAETVRLIPLERMFAETDCPFLAPQKHRGERNEPAYVAEIVEHIASLKQKESQSVVEIIRHTVQDVFSI